MTHFPGAIIVVADLAISLGVTPFVLAWFYRRRKMPVPSTSRLFKSCLAGLGVSFLTVLPIFWALVSPAWIGLCLVLCPLAGMYFAQFTVFKMLPRLRPPNWPQRLLVGFMVGGIWANVLLSLLMLH
jgi:hypothetical protein